MQQCVAISSIFQPVRKGERKHFSVKTELVNAQSSIEYFSLKKRARARYTSRRIRKRGHGGWYERVACDIEAGLSSLARCLPNTVKVHVNYRINLDSGLCLRQRWRSARVIKTFLSPDGSSTQTGVPIISI